MDSSLLVSHKFNGGLSLLAHLVRDGFEIKAAFWVETMAENLLELYIATPLVDELGRAKAYTKMIPSLRRLPGPRFILDDLHLIGQDSPIARDVLAIVAQSGNDSEGNLYGGTLGDLSINWGYIYPENFYHPQGDLANVSEELFRHLFELIGRGPGPFPPSHVALRDGRSFDGVPVAFTMEAAHPSIVKFAVADEAVLREVPAREIVLIH